MESSRHLRTPRLKLLQKPNQFDERDALHLFRLRDRTARSIFWIFEVPELWSIANAFRTHLGGSATFHSDGERPWASLQCTLNLSHAEFDTLQSCVCTFRLLPDWQTAPPVVTCLEAWIKREADWHCDQKGNLCYVLDEEWRDQLAKCGQQSDRSAKIQFAVDYAANNLRWLLYRHYMAWIQGIDTWPKQWPQWKHGEKGHLEYERLKQRR